MCIIPENDDVLEVLAGNVHLPGPATRRYEHLVVVQLLAVAERDGFGRGVQARGRDALQHFYVVLLVEFGVAEFRLLYLEVHGFADLHLKHGRF